MTTLSRSEMWERLAAHSDKLRRLVLRQNVPPCDAEDVLHDTMIKACENVDALKDVSRLEPWSNAIARNQAADYHRHRKREQMLFTSLEEKTEEWCEKEACGEATEFFTEEELLSISSEVLIRAMSKLTEPERLVFRLHVHKSYKHKEIAAMTGYSYSNVRVLYCRAKEKLERYLNEYLEREMKL